MKKKSLIFLLTAMMLIMGTSSFAVYYPDVDYTDPFSYGIYAVDEFDDTYGCSILNGFPDGTFKPYNYLTREQVAKMFVEYIGIYSPDYDATNYVYFADMDPSRWSYHYILYLSSIQIVNGYPDHTFAPDYIITRAEFARMLDNLQTYISGDFNWYLSDMYHIDFHCDYYDIDGHWARDSIEIMQTALGIDYEAHVDMFWPDYYVTRIDAAYMLHRVIYSNVYIYGYTPYSYYY